MTENLLNDMMELSNNILKEIKLSDFLYEDISNVKRLDSINWKYKNEKYPVCIVSLENDKLYKIMNSLINKKLFMQNYTHIDAPSICINNSKIKGNFSIKKLDVDGNYKVVTSRLDENTEDVFSKEIINQDMTEKNQYIIETNLGLDSLENHELIKNITFSNVILKNMPNKNIDRDKINIINSDGIRTIINSYSTIIILDNQQYLSDENKILIKNVFENIEEVKHSKIYFLIDGDKEDLNYNEIENKINDFVKKIKPTHEGIKCRFIPLEELELARALKKDIDNEELKKQFIEKYKSLIEKYDNSREEITIENLILELIDLKLEKIGFKSLEEEIIEYIFKGANEKFLNHSMKHISIVLENIATKLSMKINSLNKNNDQLYEVSEEIKTEINKLDLENYNLKYIAENEFKEIELKIGHILKTLKNSIIIGTENRLIRDNYISSYDRESLAIIIKDLESNILSSSQVIVNRELEKIKMLCIESQYKIYIESQYKLSVESQKKLTPMARDKFNELVKEFTKTTVEDHIFSKKEFEVSDYMNNFSSLESYIYSSYESDGTYTETKFDPSGAMIGTISFALAGSTIGGLIGVFIPGLNIMMSILGGAALGSISGFISTYKKEIIKEKEIKVYRVDMKNLRGDIDYTINKIVSDATKYAVSNFKSFRIKHMEFLESDMSKFLCCLSDDSCNIINSHKNEMNEMIDLKVKVDRYIKRFLKLKNTNGMSKNIVI